MDKLLEEYKSSLTATHNLGVLLRMEFQKLSVGEKAYWVLTQPSDFLDDRMYYCPHLSTSTGREVSLYDDLHWDRHETMHIHEILEMISEGWDGWDDSLSEKDNWAILGGELSTLDTPCSIVAIDMLEQCIGSAEYDW